MIISDKLFESFLKCKTKCYLLNKGSENLPHKYSEWQNVLIKDYKKEYLLKSTNGFKGNEYLVSPIYPNEFKNKNIRLAFEPSVRTSDIKSFPHAIECLSVSRQKNFIPIRFSFNEKIQKDDKLLITFDSIAMSLVTRHTPPFGKIIHGEKFVTLKVQTKVYLDSVNEIIKKIKCLIENSFPPDLILKKHCSECLFEKDCFEMAKEKDDLTLLSRMSDKKRKKLHNKGLFTITQLSYTFRPRKPNKRAKKKIVKLDHALKALAIRSKKIYVTGSPKLNLTGTLVYLDIEGIPDKDFYYLIGIRINENYAISQHSFWANSISEEEAIWRDCFNFLSNLETPIIICYGSFETRFLKRMKLRYQHTIHELEKLDEMIANSINLLTIIYGQIYFPTYSNSLKDIGHYFGYEWSEPDASGIRSLMWRSKWEVTNDNTFKLRLLKYNAEDCEALEMLTNNINQILEHEDKSREIPEESNVIHTDSLRRESPYHWGDPKFVMPELNYINKCSYWDYQRDRIYIRSNPFLKHILKRKSKKRRSPLPINKIIEPSTPLHCPKCRSTPIYKNGYHSKILYDLKISQSGIKRWIEKYDTIHYRCGSCGITFSSDNWFNTKHRYGWALISYIIYLVIEMSIPQAAVARIINQLFGYSLKSGRISVSKTRVAEYYLETYESIKHKLVNGNLIHADETKANVDGKTAYVWVFTSLEEVMFIYSETREAEILKVLLKDFHGVLVSDFYSAYDSIDCEQQKCLIHLIRDINQDALTQPFNKELKTVLHKFAELLKPIIETIDRFGLKKYFLSKHINDVKRFFRELDRYDFDTEIALKYKKRLKKYRDKLFTFLNHNGVSWNNNNAEHAIKAFARMRKILGGNTNAKGTQEYLILLSICHTCKYKEINFFEFLRSGEKDIESLI